MTQLRVISTVLLIFAVSIAHAATFVVKPGGGNGSIEAALAKAAPGDIVKVYPGIYDGFTVSKSGAAGKPITINGVLEEGKSPQISGMLAIEGSFVTIDGLTWDSVTTIPSEKSHIVFRNGARNCLVTNCTIKNGALGVYGISFDGGSAKCTVRNCVLEGLCYHNVSLDGTDNIFEKNTVSKTAYDAMRVFGERNVVRGNTFRHIDSTGVTHSDLIQTWGTHDKTSRDIVYADNLAMDCDAQIGNFSTDGSPNVKGWIMRNNRYIKIARQANIYMPMTWENNLFIDCNYNNSDHVLWFKRRSDGINDGSGSVVKKNIFLGCGGEWDGKRGWYGTAGGAARPDADYNWVATKAFMPKVGFLEDNGKSGGDPGIDESSESPKVKKDGEAGKLGIGPK